MKIPHPTRRTVLRAVTVLAVAPALPAAAGVSTHTININRMVFSPAPAGVRVGDTIAWVNQDAFRHTATARNGAFEVDLARGEAGRTVMRTAGTFLYYCRFHPNMTGQITVAR